MFVMVDKDLKVSFQEPDDLKELKLVACVPSSELPALTAALHDVASKVNVEHAWLSESWLRAQENVRDDEGWQRSFDGVVAYALKRGWVDVAAKELRAHIEWRDQV